MHISATNCELIWEKNHLSCQKFNVKFFVYCQEASLAVAEHSPCLVLFLLPSPWLQPNEQNQMRQKDEKKDLDSVMRVRVVLPVILCDTILSQHA
jgi:hypothetical protein